MVSQPEDEAKLFVRPFQYIDSFDIRHTKFEPDTLFM
jgi:hypothetical protein